MTSVYFEICASRMVQGGHLGEESIQSDRFHAAALERFVSPADRVLVLAPHPDDESLATGNLLLRARAAGASVLVAFLTSGENNPWAQRATELRLRLREKDRLRFGRRREAEALAALAALGLPGSVATFLRFPDQQLTSLLLADPEPVLSTLVGLLEAHRPTLLAYPGLADLHPDHSALGVLARVSLRRAGPALPPRELQYFVHRPTRRAPVPGAVALVRSAAETAAQRQAIAAHRSQMVWRRRFLFGFLARPEVFLPPGVAIPGSPILSSRTPEGRVRAWLGGRPRLWAFGSRTLVGVVEETTALRSFSLPLPARLRPAAPPRPTPPDPAPERPSSRRLLELPSELAPPERWCFLKLERRWGFFDEWGWVEVPPLPRAPRVNSAR